MTGSRSDVGALGVQLTCPLSGSILISLRTGQQVVDDGLTIGVGGHGGIAVGQVQHRGGDRFAHEAWSLIGRRRLMTPTTNCTRRWADSGSTASARMWLHLVPDARLPAAIDRSDQPLAIVGAPFAALRQTGVSGGGIE